MGRIANVIKLIEFPAQISREIVFLTLTARAHIKFMSRGDL